MGFLSLFKAIYDDGEDEGKKYSKKDAARDTNSSVKEVSGAWHNARNDAVGTEYEGRKEKKNYANNKR